MSRKDSKMKLDALSVPKVLKSAGWPCEQIAEDTFRTYFQGKDVRLAILVRIDPEGYLCLAIVPFLRSPENNERCAGLYTRLLELNQSLLMAKFAIDDDLDVVLSVEYPLGDLDHSEFEDALQSLTFYADEHYLGLSKLAAPA